MSKPLLILLFGSSLILQACLSGGSSATAQNPEDGTILNFDVNQYPVNKIICDPLGSPNNPGPNDGLIASLFYRKKNQKRFYDVLSYIEQGQESQKKLFFSTVEVPTRLFNMGFPTEAGSNIKNDDNETLIEYFGIRFHSVLKLAPEDQTGTYELALLSDDGANLKIRDQSGQYLSVVNNDGDHPTQLGCGQKISMDRETELFVELDYYQGPRMHISLIPMWRRVDNATATPEPLCGQKGNSLYFDYNNNSKQQTAYTDLIHRGWKPIQAQNWHLPAYANFNPCTNEQPPVISQIVESNVENFITLRWKTDKPATSQVMYRVKGATEYSITTSDNLLRLVHNVTITPDLLETNTTYEVVVVSISDTFGKTLSEPIEITTSN